MEIIDCKSLMIGDWVFNEIPCYVTAIYHNGTIDCQGDNQSISTDSVDPIPLTAEILVKNGFEAFDYFLKIQINSTLIELRPIQGNMAIWLDWNEDNDGVYADFILPYPKYLHELQHALRLCGIEKTIELYK